MKLTSKKIKEIINCMMSEKGFEFDYVMKIKGINTDENVTEINTLTINMEFGSESEFLAIKEVRDELYCCEYHISIINLVLEI